MERKVACAVLGTSLNLGGKGWVERNQIFTQHICWPSGHVVPPFNGTVLNLLLRPPALALDCGGPLDIVFSTHREHVHCGGFEISRRIVAILLT